MADFLQRPATSPVGVKMRYRADLRSPACMSAMIFLARAAASACPITGRPTTR
jgi:hypothetical protein